eukprot:1125372-Rhodomonas_salina.2
MPRVVVFDFDSTLASCEVGIFSLKDATNLAFGGHDRVEMLRNLLESLHRRGIKLVIVSYNSKHVIEKVCCAVAFCICGAMPGSDMLAIRRLLTR